MKMNFLKGNTSENELYIKEILKEVSRFSSLPIHILHLYLSNTVPELQKNIAPYVRNLLELLENSNDLFEINEMLEVRSKAADKSNDCLTDGDGTILPKKILNGRGKVSRLFTTYGFLNSIQPFKTGIYFSSRILKNSHELSPLDDKFSIGQLVGFDAEFGNGCKESPYKAINIWAVAIEDDEDDPYETESVKSFESKPKSNKHKYNKTNIRNKSENVLQEQVFYPTRKKTKHFEQLKLNHKTSKVSKLTNIKIVDEIAETRSELSGDGKINNLFLNFGFITANGKTSNKVFFALSNVTNLQKRESDLRNILKIGDDVQFTAVKSSKKYSKVSWEATSVIIKKFPTTVPDQEQNVEEKKYFPPLEVIKENLKCNKELKNSSNHLQNNQGKIYIQSDTTAVIKFGPQFQFSVTAEDCPFYEAGQLVDDLNWIFDNGDLVRFNAKRKDEKSNWVATLVWQGDKPEILSENDKESLDSDCEIKLDAHTRAEEYIFLKSIEKVNDSTINWADVPYSEDENETSELSTTKSESQYSSAESYTSGRSSEKYRTFEFTCHENSEKFNDNYAGNNDKVTNNGKFLKSKDINETEDSQVTNTNEDENYNSSINHSNNNLNIRAEKKECNKFEDVLENEPVKVSNSQSSVHVFENTKGRIVKIYRIHIDIECPETKRISVIRNDLYHDGVPIREKCQDLKQLLKVGDNVNLNFFEVIDDHGSVFRKVTLAWVGEKPKKVKEMELTEFIESHELEVSCEIPTKKRFSMLEKQKHTSNANKNILKQQSTSPQGLRLLNQSEDVNNDNISPRKKFLFEVSPITDDSKIVERSVHSLNNSNFNSVNEANIPEEISILLAHCQRLKYFCKDNEFLKEVSELEKNINTICVSQLKPHVVPDGIPNTKTISVNSSSQTTEIYCDKKHSKSGESVSNPSERKETVTVSVQTLSSGEIFSSKLLPF